VNLELRKEKLETEILNIARRNNVRLIGPNCMGIYNPKVGMAFSHGKNQNLDLLDLFLKVAQ